MFNRKIYMKKYRTEHKKEIEKQSKEYYVKNREKRKQYQNKYDKNHKIQTKKYHKRRYLDNKEKLLKQAKIYRTTHKNIRKKYCILHKEKLKEYKKEYEKNRRNKDIDYKILCNLRTRLSIVLKGKPKLETTMKLVGCSIDFLKQHLEKKFTECMTWDNYGYWHIDHIKPCASFNMSNSEDQKLCFHYTNLQPLWAKENLRKSCSL